MKNFFNHSYTKTLLHARHYFLSCCMILLWITIGFFIVTQSKAEEEYNDILSTIPSPTLSVLGPENQSLHMVYPIQKSNVWSHWVFEPEWSKAYEYLLRKSLEDILNAVKESCWFSSQIESFEHITWVLESWINILNITDAWCITSSLSDKYKYDDPLIATKLPLIKALTLFHAWNKTTIIESMRELPLESRFDDYSTRWSRSDYILYAEYHGLLEWVEWDRLDVLRGFSDWELERVFVDYTISWEALLLHEMYEQLLHDEEYLALYNILLFHPTNQKIIKSLFARMHRMPSSRHETLLKKLHSWITQDSLELIQLKKRISKNL